jgi:hypothetical protein
VPDAASRRPVRPLVELRGASRTTARRTRTAIGSRPTRAAFRRPAGGHPPDLLPTRGSGISPPCAFVLLQRHVPAAPHRGVTPPNSCESTEDPSRGAASPGLSRPTTHARPADPRVMQRIPPLLRAACGVWLPPSRPPPPVLPTPKRRSVPGLDPSRCSPRARAVPLSGSLPS